MFNMKALNSVLNLNNQGSSGGPPPPFATNNCHYYSISPNSDAVVQHSQPTDPRKDRFVDAKFTTCIITLKCYSQILCGGCDENLRFWLFCIDLVAN